MTKHKHKEDSARDIPSNEETLQEETGVCGTAEKRQETSSLDTELELLKKESAEYKDKYIRLLAESENTRKRLQKERQEMIQYSVQNTIIDFLNPIDHMENALNHAKDMSEEVRHWAIGFEMILTQFKDILANNGVVPFKSKGEPFDPHRHEAVEMIETEDYLPGIVVSETVRGYRMGDRTIRPARVSVAKEPAPKQPSESPLSSKEEA